MKRWSLLALILASVALMAETCPTPTVQKCTQTKVEKACAAVKAPAPKEVMPRRLEPLQIERQSKGCTLSTRNNIHFQVVGQGVAPVNTVSPAQAIALAKRAAIADAYRQLGEKICGVRIEGRDLVRNMMVSRSTVRTQIDAIIRNAKILDTRFKDGLYEVEMEVTVNGKEWYDRFAR